jgi:hypothetical protein
MKSERFHRRAGFGAFAVIAACGGPGAYGHAPAYAPTDAETSALAGAREYDPGRARAHGAESSKESVTFFGVVEARSPGPGGQALLKLRLRTLAQRNACRRPDDADSCRVTVSERDGGTLWALVSLRGDDDVGPVAVGQQSLVRVVGRPGQDVSPADGAPVVHAVFYRHWPVGEYAVEK